MPEWMFQTLVVERILDLLGRIGAGRGRSMHEQWGLKLVVHNKRRGKFEGRDWTTVKIETYRRLIQDGICERFPLQLNSLVVWEIFR